MQVKKIGRGRLTLTVERKSMLNIKIYSTYHLEYSGKLWSISGGGYVKSGKRLADVLLFCSTKDKWV